MIKNIGTILFFVILLSNPFSYGQIRTFVFKSEIDSLIGITELFDGIKKVDHLNLVATSISQRYPDSCFYYANKAMELSKSLNYSFGEAEAVFNIGNGYYFKLDIKNATINYLFAVSLFENLKPSQQYGNLLLQIGALCRYLENDLKAIEYYRRAKTEFMNVDNEISEVVATYEIGYSYIRSNQFDSAFLNLHEALRACKKLDEIKHLTIIYDYIGITYEWRDDLMPEHERSGGWDAIPYLDSCYYYANLCDFDLYKEISLSNIGECYHHYIYPPDYQKAEEFYLKALSVKLDGEKYKNRAATLGWLGELYADIGKYDLSKFYLDIGLKKITALNSHEIDTTIYFQFDRIYNDINYSWWSKYYIYTGYMELYQYMGQHDKAILYSEYRHKALDSLYQMQTRNQIYYLLANSENELKKQQIEFLKKEKELQQSNNQQTMLINFGVAGFVIILMIAIILYLRHNRLEIVHDKANLQQKLLRSQMNPHFIFNSLASIQNSIINEEPAKASKYLAMFSKLVRNILDSSIEETIPLEEEIITIENYLSLQKIRFPEKFDYTIFIDEKIDTISVQIPPMLGQPFIENAIEHGFRNKQTMGDITINFNFEDNSIIYEVIDNGIGRKKAMEIMQDNDKDHKSLATSITSERIKVLNKKLKSKITLFIEDLEDEKSNPAGTKVRFEIPI